MRLDKYLKVSRIIKRRTVANEACDSGRVMLNDKVARASVLPQLWKYSIQTAGQICLVSQR